VQELTIAEVAYLAALPKEPSALNPFRDHDRAVERRNYVIGRMAEDGYITPDQAQKARSEPLTVNPRVLTPDSIAAGFFAEEVRRELLERYGEQKVYEGGLSVRTTLDPKLQLMARKALVDGLVRYDEAHGWHGTVKSIDLGQDWGVALADIPQLGDIKPWRLAVVLDANDISARIGLQPDRDPSGAVGQDRETGSVAADGTKWTGKKPRALVKPGDVVYVEPVAGRANIACGRYPKCRAPASRWIRSPAASSPWSAASPTTSRSSTAPPRRCASPAPRSSRSSTRRRSITAIRHRQSSSTPRSTLIWAMAKSGARQILRANRRGPIRCVSASSIRSTR
jgi:membrane carboxypeptidase/penicillin-binding protein